MGIVILRKQQSFRRTCYIGVGPDQTAIRQPVMRNESTGAKCRTVTYIPEGSHPHPRIHYANSKASGDVALSFSHK